MVCITFTDWFRGRTSVWFVLLLLIGLEEGVVCITFTVGEEGLCITFTDWFRGRTSVCFV